MGIFRIRTSGNLVLDLNPWLLALRNVMVESVELETKNQFLLVRVADSEQQKAVTEWLHTNEVKEVVEIATQGTDKLYRFRITSKTEVCDMNYYDAYDSLKSGVMVDIYAHTHEYSVRPLNDDNIEHEVYCVRIKTPIKH